MQKERLLEERRREEKRGKENEKLLSLYRNNWYFYLL
jgi:hypothetical protein